MTLALLIAQLVAIVAALTVVGLLSIVGRERLGQLRAEYRERFRTVLPSLAVLAGVLVINSVARPVVPEVSWLVGIDITSAIYRVEGYFVVWLQSFATPELTAYFAFVYVYGYAFLLVFPLVAYFALSNTEPLRETALAYTLNYAIGVTCYLLFIVFGPRNFMPEAIEPLLYTHWPETRLLTSQINTETNAFPSLHTSLSVTVALLAYRTRQVYPRWVPVAWFLAASVVFSTMYLGIHWFTDVVAGAILAYVSVTLAARLVRENTLSRWNERWIHGRFEAVRSRIRAVGNRVQARREQDPGSGPER